tara:strand:+ start:116 stop:757 length:642 start_codon:yes stop_codon:yes gene_type:complete
MKFCSKYDYWYFESALSKKFCEELILYGNQKIKSIGTVGDIPPVKNKHELSKKDKKALKTIRKSDVTFLNDFFIYNAICPFIQEANKNAGWNYEWSFSEDAQFTTYNKGYFYEWHTDGSHQPYKSPNQNYDGKIRKLSVTVSLSDPKDYEGGHLEFDLSNPKQGNKRPGKLITEIRPQGSIVVFPSYVWHRVTPVTKGTRYSLVIWSIGKPWR